MNIDHSTIYQNTTNEKKSNIYALQLGLISIISRRCITC